MKRFILTCAVVVLTVSGFAQHYIGVNVAGDIPLQADNLNFTKSAIAGGGEVGATYQLLSRHFLLSTGVNFSLQAPRIKLQNQQLEQDMVDTRGIDFIYRGEVGNRTDMATIYNITLPLMLGSDFNNAYLLFGIRFNFALAANTKEKAELRTYGDYGDRYYEFLENMPNHGFHDYEKIKNTGKVTFEPDIRLSAEIGYTFHLDKIKTYYGQTLLRLGFFAEYGVSNAHSGSSEVGRTEADYSEYMQATLTHIYAASESNGKKVHNSTIGIRATLLFPFAKIGSHNYNCKCW